MTSWTPGWDAFPARLRDFWAERHLSTLTTVRQDGRPHVVPVGVVLDHEQRCAWVITNESSHKVRHIGAGPRTGTGTGTGTGVPVAACQVEGRHWSTLEGRAQVLTDVESVRRAVECYTARYRTPSENPARVAIRIEVDRFLMSSGMTG